MVTPVVSFLNLKIFLYLPEAIFDLKLFNLGRDETRPVVVNELGAWVEPRSESKVIPRLTESDDPKYHFSDDKY